jgi:hypothetical protein
MRRVTLALMLGATLSVAAVTPAPAGLGSEDQDIADESVLTIDDVPTGFEIAQPDDEDEGAPGRACRSVRRGRDALNEAPNAEAEFRVESQAFINNKVAVFERAREARAAFRGYAGPATAECFERTYSEEFERQIGSPDAEVDVTVDRFEPDLGDDAVGYEIEIEASAEGESETFYVELQVVRVGRAVDGFAFFSTGRPPPSDDVVDMVETGVDRLTAALGTR